MQVKLMLMTEWVLNRSQYTKGEENYNLLLTAVINVNSPNGQVIRCFIALIKGQSPPSNNCWGKIPIHQHLWPVDSWPHHSVTSWNRRHNSGIDFQVSEYNHEISSSFSCTTLSWLCATPEDVTASTS